MNDGSFPGYDVLVPLLWLLLVVAVSAMAFRRLLWLRVLCVVIALLSVLGSVVRISVAPRMAADRLEREGRSWSEAFRDGSVYTIRYAETTYSTQLVTGVVLAVLALVPLKRRAVKAEDDAGS